MFQEVSPLFSHPEFSSARAPGWLCVFRNTFFRFLMCCIGNLQAAPNNLASLRNSETTHPVETLYQVRRPNKVSIQADAAFRMGLMQMLAVHPPFLYGCAHYLISKVSLVLTALRDPNRNDGRDGSDKPTGDNSEQRFIHTILGVVVGGFLAWASVISVWLIAERRRRW